MTWLLDFDEAYWKRGASGDGPSARIDIVGEIDRDLTACIAAELEDCAEAVELEVYVDSPGGDFAAAFDLFVHIARHRAGRKTAIIRRAESGALLAALAADQRIAEPGASILLHGASAPCIGRETAAAHLEAAEHLRWLDANKAALFAHRTGMSPEIFAAAMADEEPAPLAWCLANNLITQIQE
ncbi:MAG: ATP-dependent Clp protease proteolytic subunit [Mesorhizobium sp.]